MNIDCCMQPLLWSPELGGDCATTLVQGRPGAGLPPVNLRQLENNLKEQHGKNSITYRDVMSAAMYPKVFVDFK